MYVRVTIGLVIVVLMVIFFKPIYSIGFIDKKAEEMLLASLNKYASIYIEKEKACPAKFTDFVDFDALAKTSNQNLNIYSFYKHFDEQKRFEGYNTSSMTIYFKNGSSPKKITYKLHNGKVIMLHK